MKHSNLKLQQRFESLSDKDLQTHIDYYPKGSDESGACKSIQESRKVKIVKRDK